MDQSWKRKLIVTLVLHSSSSPFAHNKPKYFVSIFHRNKWGIKNLKRVLPYSEILQCNGH